VTTNITAAQVEVDIAKKKGDAAETNPPYLIIAKCGHFEVTAA